MNGLSFAFLNPIALSGLIALPVLWFILRFFPPAPKLVLLPTARFLEGLHAKDAPPATAPWWLILLRFLILLFIILGLAGPVLNPQKPMEGTGPVRLIFDNSWSSAQTWDLQMAKAQAILESARKSGRMTELVATASFPAIGLTPASEALKSLKSLKPQPWPSQFPEIKIQDNPAQNFWVSSGIADKGFHEFAEKLSQSRELMVFLPDMKARPGILRSSSSAAPDAGLRAEILPGAGKRQLILQAHDSRSRLQGQMNIAVSGERGGQIIDTEGDIFKGKPLAQWKILDFAGAGGVSLNARIKGSSIIGFVGPAEEQDFTDALFYLSRAAEPFAKIETGNIENLIEKDAGVIILADVVNFTPDALDQIEKWIARGGILLRFGGTRMSETDNVLLPVPLKSGMRSLSGELNWGSTLKLGSFPKCSPFYGSPLPDITVERQLLAEPSPDLQDRVWAQLSDGTPFITARSQGRGLIVLVHTTATPDWSDFALSGFYVSFLKEISEMSALSDKSAPVSQILQPVLMLDGWGRLVPPDDNVKPIERKDIASLDISPSHPPGLYGNETQRYARNLGDIVPSLEMVDSLPDNARMMPLGDISGEKNLKPLFLVCALILFLCDWLVRIVTLRGSLTAIIVLILIVPFTHPVQADDDTARASSIHLACVHTSKDDVCRKGLERLSLAIKERTSAEMGNAAIVDLEHDELSFYPLLYWPVEEQQELTPKARANLENYLSKGGMVLVDTQSGDMDGNSYLPSPALSDLRETLRRASIPPLKPADKDHVLFKSFYLLNQRPEYDLSGRIWVEEDSIAPQEGLSSVIITDGDWMRIWGYASDPLDAEMSYRFGINLMLYALTGNYKADQVHMNKILERLGE